MTTIETDPALELRDLDVAYRVRGLERQVLRGVSLTIAAVDNSGVGIALVPHTLRETTLTALEPGDGVNLEADVLAKYVERLAER